MKVFLVPICLALSSCVLAEYEPINYDRVKPQSEAEISFVKSALADIQSLSIEKNREYCGFVGLNKAGEYAVSKPRKGRKGSCVPKEPGEDFTILASFHTHGAWSEDYDSEVPSTDDLRSDIEEGNDGYVLTPGGRLWYNDVVREIAILLCDIDCVVSDPDFEDDLDNPIEKSYDLDGLEAREQVME